jgi:hypothetical protein
LALVVPMSIVRTKLTGGVSRKERKGNSRKEMQTHYFAAFD